MIDHLSDNEKETRLKWKDLMGKETTLDMDDDGRHANRWEGKLINDDQKEMLTAPKSQNIFSRERRRQAN